MTPMLTHRPPPSLAPFVEALWIADAPVSPGLEFTVPTGHLQLLVNLADDRLSWFDDVDSARAGRRNSVTGVGVCGPRLSPVVIDRVEQRWCAGVTLRPGAAPALLGVPAAALADPVVGLDEVWGTDGPRLRERMLAESSASRMLDVLAAVLHEHAAPAALASPSGRGLGLREACRLLAAGMRVADVADRLGWSASTLMRRFRLDVGVVPKSYARLRRVQRVFTAIDPDEAPDWSELAIRCGFFDQAHLVNEFRDLTGTTPARYRRLVVPEARNHVTVG